MKTLKTITKALLIILTLGAFVMMTAEASTPGMQLITTCGSGAILLMSTKILDKMGVFDEED